MLAYHNNPKIKSAILAELEMHRKADDFVQGRGYWRNGKGCAVGCTLKSGNHIEYETRYGIPIMLARLEDCIFEGLPVEAARVWPGKFMGAICPGQDLARVAWKFVHWLLTDIAINPGIYHPLVKDAVKSVADLIAVLAEVSAAESAAESALVSAAESAAESAVHAARAVVRAAERVAESAPESAVRAALAALAAVRAAERAAESAVHAVRAARAVVSAAERAALAESAVHAVHLEGAAEYASASAARAAWIKMSNKLVELIIAA